MPRLDLTRPSTDTVELTLGDLKNRSGDIVPGRCRSGCELDTSLLEDKRLRVKVLVERDLCHFQH
jgi:hypothetical protein